MLSHCCVESASEEAGVTVAHAGVPPSSPGHFGVIAESSHECCQQKPLFSFSNSISSPYGHGGKPGYGGLICGRRTPNVSRFSPHLIEAQHAPTKVSSSSKRSGGSKPLGEATLQASPSQAGRRRADRLLGAA